MSEWIYFLHPPRPDFAATISPEEEKVFAGPTFGSVNTGICIFRAPDEPAALCVMNGDPIIQSNIMRGELRPMMVSLLQGRNFPQST